MSKILHLKKKVSSQLQDTFFIATLQITLFLVYL